MSTFVPAMRKWLCILVVFSMTCFVVAVHAEVVVLQSGETFTGEVLLQNDDVVLLKDANGRRYQFPRDQVSEIMTPVAEEQVVKEEPKQPTTTNGQVALRLDLSGGAAFAPSLANGGYGSVDLQIGTRSLAGKRIFLGGSVGYQGAAAGKLYNFLPLAVVVSVPLMEGKHAPEVGAALGYAFALKQPVKGGMTAKVDISWRYQFKPSSALLLGVQARFQQAQVTYVETVDKKEYTSSLGRSFASIGIRLALVF